MGALKFEQAAMKIDDLTADAVRSLRTLPTVAELVESTPEIIGRMGYDRVILSELRDDIWTPLNVGIDKDKPWAEDILTAGKMHPQRMNPALIESAMVRALRPIHVVDVQENPEVHKAIATASKCQAYVAVPVIVGSEVGAFIHVDRYWSADSFNVDDAARLTVFAEMLGLALERAHVVDTLSKLAAEIGTLSQGTVFAPPVAQQRRPIHDSPLRVELTPREREVAELVAEGCTNEQIATELVLSEATVKSHVKHILRKLNASHRAEAVSKLIRSGLA